MAKKATKTASIETLEPRIYEIGYLLSPAVRDEDLAVRTDELKATLTNLGGTIFAEGNAEFIDLAYEMAKVINNKRIRFNQAYFGWLKFELDPSKMNELKELLDKNTLVIRYLLTLAVRENTIIGKKPLGKILKSGKRDAASDSEIPADVAETADADDAEVSEAPVDTAEAVEPEAVV